MRFYYGEAVEDAKPPPPPPQLTVKALKDLLSQVPDELLVWTESSDNGEDGEADGIEIFTDGVLMITRRN